MGFSISHGSSPSYYGDDDTFAQIQQKKNKWHFSLKIHCPWTFFKYSREQHTQILIANEKLCIHQELFIWTTTALCKMGAYVYFWTHFYFIEFIMSYHLIYGNGFYPYSENLRSIFLPFLLTIILSREFLSDISRVFIIYFRSILIRLNFWEKNKVFIYCSYCSESWTMIFWSYQSISRENKIKVIRIGMKACD